MAAQDQKNLLYSILIGYFNAMTSLKANVAIQFLVRWQRSTKWGWSRKMTSRIANDGFFEREPFHRVQHHMAAQDQKNVLYSILIGYFNAMTSLRANVVIEFIVRWQHSEAGLIK